MRGWLGSRPARRALLAGVLLLAIAAEAAPAAGQSFAETLALGDAAWAGRGRGADGGRTDSTTILESIGAYEGALAADSDSWAACWKLLRSLHFAATFTSEPENVQRSLLDRATAVSEACLDRLASRTSDGERFDRLRSAELPPRALEAGAASSDVARLHFWTAINWGAWSQRVGLLGAVREGVANRLHRYVQVTLALEPDYDQGGAYRLLGRLHAALPRVPLLSGWVDRDAALPLIEQGFALAPDHPGNRLLLALTILELAPERSEEAIRLLSAVAALEPRPSMRVEDLAMREEAGERLEEMAAADGEASAR